MFVYSKFFCIRLKNTSLDLLISCLPSLKCFPEHVKKLTLSVSTFSPQFDFKCYVEMFIDETPASDICAAMNIERYLLNCIIC